MAHILAARDEFADAIGYYQTALDLRPDDAALHLKMAGTCLKAGRPAPALAHYRRSIALDPASAEAHGGLGAALQEAGDIDGARAAYRAAISLDPTQLTHHLALAHISRLAPDDPVLTSILALTPRISDLTPADQINAHFTLGKALADIGRNDEAFDHLLAGNAVRRGLVDYDEPRAIRAMGRIQAAFSADRLSRWPAAGHPSDAPIFIVGMPRSGSTLVEQILANHPAVICAGESSALRDSLLPGSGEATTRRFMNRRLTPTAEDMTDLAERYLAAVRAEAEAATSPARAAAAHRITDKMLSNFRYIGLIHRLFPRARILHTFRDPIDTCLSCFSINFVTQPFAFDLGELGRHYRAYAMLMRHWKQTLPAGTVFDIRYEAVARNLEPSARAIVAHCGLEWDDACLRFYEADRPVRTASVEQVRRPIYQSSVRRWRPPDAKLRPLTEGLGLSAPPGRGRPPGAPRHPAACTHPRDRQSRASARPVQPKA
jgi:thioredoxin-like negative regulator of GroEL